LLVENMPPGYFGPAQGPLLLQLVRHVVRCDELEAAIAATAPDAETYEKLCRLAIAESSHVAALSRALRLTLQAKLKAEGAERLGARGGAARSIDALFNDD
jgi:hypothetical protein